MATFLCSCANTANTGDTIVTEGVDTEDQSGVITPDPAYSSDKYRIIAIDEYMDKTTAAFLGQLAGFLSGPEYARDSSGKCAVAMPDYKYRYLGGLYAEDSYHDKHIKNMSTGIWELWFDDDFSVDVVNQYILGDMYRQKYTICQKYITDGWIRYDVWDMGGGQRQAGAFGTIQRNNYLPQFAGNAEYENWYCFISELLGSLRIRTKASSSRSLSDTVTGIRPTSSGISPNFTMS